MSPSELAVWMAIITFGAVFVLLLVVELIRNPLPMGTRSLLYGSHTFWLHPVFVAVAWCKLWGFPLDPLYWVAFLVHDWGYWGKPNIDGAEGRTHPYWGARVMGKFGQKWYWFTLLHSREMCTEHSREPSRLCYADKLAVALTPAWLFVLQIRLSGEWHEIVRTEKYEENVAGFRTARDLWAKHRAMQQHLKNWVRDHIDEVEETYSFAPRDLEEEGLDPDALADARQSIVDGKGLTPNQVRRALRRPPKELTFSEAVAFCLGKPSREATAQEISAAVVRAHALLSEGSEEPPMTSPDATTQERT